MKKMWEGRFHQRPDARFERWQRSLPFDHVLFPYELAGSRAYARALAKIGLLTSAELAAILGALEKIAKEVEQTPALLQNKEAEDIHHLLESWLVERIGDPGLKIHTGRSRNEQVATSLRLFTRDRIDSIRQRLADLIEVLLARAHEHRSVAMPAYTHLQRAQPVLLAHWLLAYVEMFLRDAERLADCRRRVNVSPLGSGAVAGASVPLDRAAMAKDLGFEAVSANSIDATSDRDFAIEFVQGLSLIAVHLSRLAEELILFSTVEYGFVRLPEQFSTGSSAMPQKKNPDAMELLRGKVGRVLGAAVSLLVTQKGLPLAYNKDLQETQEPLFDAAETVSDALQIARDFMRAVEFDTARMQAAASSGYLNATAAANYLVKRGLPFREAHAITGKAVRHALEKGCELETLSLDELKQFSAAFAEDFFDSLTLDKVLAEHNVVGGTDPKQVGRALADAQRRLAALRGQEQRITV